VGNCYTAALYMKLASLVCGKVSGGFFFFLVVEVVVLVVAVVAVVVVVLVAVAHSRGVVTAAV